MNLLNGILNNMASLSMKHSLKVSRYVYILFIIFFLITIICLYIHSFTIYLTYIVASKIKTDLLGLYVTCIKAALLPVSGRVS